MRDSDKRSNAIDILPTVRETISPPALYGSTMSVKLPGASMKRVNFKSPEAVRSSKSGARKRFFYDDSTLEREAKANPASGIACSNASRRHGAPPATSPESFPRRLSFKQTPTKVRPSSAGPTLRSTPTAPEYRFQFNQPIMLKFTIRAMLEFSSRKLNRFVRCEVTIFSSRSFLD